MEDKLYWIWLSNIDKVGPIKIKKLLENFETAQGIWYASKEELNTVVGIGPALSNNIMESKLKFSPELEAKKLEKYKVKLVTWQDKCYPKLLKEIYAPPPVLYYQGSLAGLKAPCIAVVGTRNCSEYGKRTAYQLSKKLAQQGISIISGLARGIDTKGHQGALQGGRTYAILGSGLGLDNIYPPENKNLATQIIKQGAVITAYPLGTKAKQHNFPARNRLISGLSLGTLVVEAPNKSGALITANYALKQNREVFAVPSDICRKQSVGSNKLIKSGAKLVSNLKDIIEELRLEKYLVENKSTEMKTKKLKSLNDLTTVQKEIYQLLDTEAQQFEKILAHVKIKSEQLTVALLKLEVAGLAEQLPGKRFRILN